MTPRLGDTVRIADGDPDARYRWQRWNGHTDQALLIDLDTGEMLKTYGRNLVMIQTQPTLVKDPTLQTLRDELERLNVVGRVVSIETDTDETRRAFAIIKHLPSLTLFDLRNLRGYWVCDGGTDWKAIMPQSLTPSPVLNADAAGHSVELTKEQMLADILGPEPDEDDDFDDTPDLPATTSDSPRPEGEGLGVRVSEGIDLTTHDALDPFHTIVEHLPHGEQQPVAVRDRVLDADHTAAPDEMVGYLTTSEEIDLLEAQLRAAQMRNALLEQRNEELADKLDARIRQSLFAATSVVAAGTTIERKLEIKTLYQENMQDPYGREECDKELSSFIVAGWSIEHEQIVVVGPTVIRVIRLQRWAEPDRTPQPPARVAADAFGDFVQAIDFDQPLPLDAYPHRAVSKNGSVVEEESPVIVTMHTGVRIIGLSEDSPVLFPSPSGTPRSVTECKAEGMGLGVRASGGEVNSATLAETIAALDRQAYEAGAAAVAAFRNAQPPTFTPIPRALPAPV